jgi:hypothetical protein
MPFLLLLVGGIVLVAVTPYATLGWILIAVAGILSLITLAFAGAVFAAFRRF